MKTYIYNFFLFKILTSVHQMPIFVTRINQSVKIVMVAIFATV